jgi:hypothetical protein
LRDIGACESEEVESSIGLPEATSKSLPSDLGKASMKKLRERFVEVRRNGDGREPTIGKDAFKSFKPFNPPDLVRGPFQPFNAGNMFNYRCIALLPSSLLTFSTNLSRNLILIFPAAVNVT